ncbi:hypothetical protein UFOVP111_69 [uncultured Caudovirales phage]|uniref:Uncharacterized protein n=1 Tax=uncultured Caudovirales phage TaxID=2100421 RepID=A0A6J5L585_9CAUD|nr:hypothetical protein UFOVP111_69 [uncultured Caudovirales phage]
MAIYPDNVKQWAPRTDNVDKVVAVDVNSAYDEITAIETQLGQGGVTTSDWNGATVFATTTTNWGAAGGLKGRLLNIEAGVKKATSGVDGGTPASNA